MIVKCILLVNLLGGLQHSGYVQGEALNTSGDHWLVDFTDNFRQLGADFELNAGVQAVNSNNCLVVKDEEL